MPDRHTQKPYEIDFRKKRISAFLTTSLALFCLILFLTSASIRQFTTFTDLQITSDLANIQSHIRTAIDEHTSDEKLSSYVTSAANNADLVANPDIATHNLAEIRDSLDMQLSQDRVANQYVLSIQYRGRGTDCEKFLTRRIAHALARQLDSRLSHAHAKDKIAEVITAIEQQINHSSDHQFSSLESASKFVSQINAELSNIHRSVEELDRLSPPRIREGLSVSTDQILTAVNTLDEINAAINQLGQPDRQVDVERVDEALTNIRQLLVNFQRDVESSKSGSKGPMRVVNTSLGTRNSRTGEVLTSLQQIDTDTLQRDLTGVSQEIRDNAVTVREQIVNLKIANKSMSDGTLTVDSIKQLRTTPFRSSPGLSHIILFGLISCFLGACISVAYQPAMDGLGFDSPEQTAKALGIPVIATIMPTASTVEHPNGIANTVVRVAEVVLFAFLLLIILLCLVQPEIREAMFANPFYGLSKISALFFG